MGTAARHYPAARIHLWERCGPLTLGKTGTGKPGEAQNIAEMAISVAVAINLGPSPGFKLS